MRGSAAAWPWRTGAVSAIAWLAATLSLVTPAGAASVSTLTICVSPARIVLGSQDATATIDITTADVDSRIGVAGLRVDATAGKVSGLHALGGGRFRAVLNPPSDRFPQIAVVSVADIATTDATHPPDVQVAAVAFAAPIDLKGKSEPNVRISIDIGQKRFGPVPTDPQGRFTVPVIVEPGEGWAVTVATDRLGNTSRSRISLYLPAVQRLQAYVFPEVLIADGNDTGWVYVTSLGPTGAPRAAVVGARAEHGSITRSDPVAPGLTRFAYRTPRSSERGSDTLVLTASNWDMTASFAIPLTAGPPSSLSATVTPSPTPADGSTVTKLRVVSRDSAGNPAAGHRLVISIDDEVTAAKETAPGTYDLELPAQKRAGHRSAQVRLQPQARRCSRPRAVTSDGRLWVVDRRGIACLGELAGVATNGQAQWRQLLAPGDESMGVSAPSLDDLLLIFTDAEGGQHVVVPPATSNAAPTTLAPAIEQSLELAWSVPVPTELRLITIERHANSARVRLEGHGVSDLVHRARLEAAGATVRQVAVGTDSVDFAIDWPAGHAIDVLATDSNTGVSAWLRLE